MTPDELKGLRLERGLSLRVAARLFYMSYQQLAKLERGQHRIPKTREQLIRTQIERYDRGELE